MGGKLREFKRISSRFLAFPGMEYSGVFQCHWPALFAHSLSQSTAKTKEIDNSKNMIYLMYSTVYYLECTTIYIKYEGNFPF